MKPWPVAILAIDPGACSGVAMYHGGGCARSASAAVMDQWRIVSDFETRCIQWGLPGVLVIENSTPHGRWGAKAYAGLHANRAMWLQVWSKASEGSKRLAKKRVVKVYPATWRARLFGTGVMRGDTARTMAIAHVREEFDLDIDNHNQAEAICIGQWATYAPEVGAVLSKRIKGGMRC